MLNAAVPLVTKDLGPRIVLAYLPLSLFHSLLPFFIDSTLYILFSPSNLTSTSICLTSTGVLGEIKSLSTICLTSLTIARFCPSSLFHLYVVLGRKQGSEKGLKAEYCPSSNLYLIANLGNFSSNRPAVSGSREASQYLIPVALKFTLDKASFLSTTSAVIVSISLYLVYVGEDKF